MSVKGTPENFSDNLAKTEGCAHHPILEMVDDVLPLHWGSLNNKIPLTAQNLCSFRSSEMEHLIPNHQPSMPIHGVRDITQVQHPAKPNQRFEFGSRRHFWNVELYLPLNLTCCRGRVDVSNVLLGAAVNWRASLSQ